MAFSDPSLTGLTANVTLPSGMNGKVRAFNCSENRRYKDSEGLGDGGFATGKLTGQRLTGRLAGFMTTSALGIGTSFENVALTLTYDSGRTITGNFDITDIDSAASVGEITNFTANFISNGPYTSSSV